MWNTMRVNKALRKSMDGSFGRSIAFRKCKYISRASVCSSKKKMLPFHVVSGPL